MEAPQTLGNGIKSTDEPERAQKEWREKCQKESGKWERREGPSEWMEERGRKAKDEQGREEGRRERRKERSVLLKDASTGN